MNGRELRDRLYALARENRTATWEQMEAVVNIILTVYMSKGREYDAEQAVASMERFNRSGWLVF